MSKGEIRIFQTNFIINILDLSKEEENTDNSKESSFDIEKDNKQYQTM